MYHNFDSTSEDTNAEWEDKSKEDSAEAQRNLNESARAVIDSEYSEPESPPNHPPALATSNLELHTLIVRAEYLEMLQVGAEQNMQSSRDFPDTESDFLNAEDDFDGEYDITRTTRSAGLSPPPPPTKDLELELGFARTVTTKTCNRQEAK